VAGQAGAERVLAILGEETRRVLGQVGSPRITDVNADLVVLPAAQMRASECDAE
jgi:isopentenyl diphosphate isomerase/L-lactate dehydrogenase-like FMN-dependent dehydrogenase